MKTIVAFVLSFIYLTAMTYLVCIALGWLGFSIVFAWKYAGAVIILFYVALAAFKIFRASFL